jgi:flagellar hook protein FlgE
MIGGVATAGLGQISPHTLEKSNVDLAKKFSRMILRIR